MERLSPRKEQNNEDDDAEKTGWSGGNEYITDVVKMINRWSTTLE